MPSGPSLNTIHQYLLLLASALTARITVTMATSLLPNLVPVLASALRLHTQVYTVRSLFYHGIAV